jgi:Protein of unknown function (DUF3892)
MWLPVFDADYTARRQDRPSAHEQIQAICGIKPDGSHWSLTQDEAISQVEDGVSVFYVERPGGRRIDVIVAMDFHAHNTSKRSPMENSRTSFSNNWLAAIDIREPCSFRTTRNTTKINAQFCRCVFF